MRALYLSILGFASPLISLHQKPLLPSPYELHFKAAYLFAYYPSIQGAINPSSFSSNENWLDLNLEVANMSDWHFEIETNFDATRMLPFNFESVALQIKKRLTDDDAGAFLSSSLAFDLRVVPKERLTDPTTPYHQIVNFELAYAIAKGIHFEDEVFVRPYSILVIGIANKGYPWLRPTLGIEAGKDHFTGELSADFYMGFGHENQVNVDTFNGYAFIAHRSLDLIGKLAYHMPVGPKATLSYFYRPYASAYPANRQGVTFAIDIPFSLF